eukprot:3471186-Prymnesium_polylepis.1
MYLEEPSAGRHVLPANFQHAAHPTVKPGTCWDRSSHVAYRCACRECGSVSLVGSDCDASARVPR